MTEDEVLKEQLDTLRSKKPTIAELLYASPFDPNRNIGGAIKWEIFSKKLFVNSPNLDDLAAHLLSELNSTIENNRIFLLDGYSGIGKTTFIYKFINENNLTNYVYIDFHSIPSRGMGKSPSEVITESISHVLRRIQIEQHDISLIEILESQIEAESPIVSVLKGKVYELLADRSLDEVNSDFFDFLTQRKETLAPYFSPATIATLQKAAMSEDLRRDFLQLITFADLNDVFMFIFVHCFCRFDRNSQVLMFFDNLDAVHIDYLSEYFRREFKNALNNATSLAQNRKLFDESFSFETNFKFIFCLRDGNGSIVNSHLQSSYSGFRKKLSFRVQFDSSSFKQMVENRISLYEEIASPVPPNVEDGTTIRTLLKQFTNDKYSREVIIPLFNFDYRKVSQALFELAKTIREQMKTIPNIDSADPSEKYGVRGSLLFGVLQYLWQDDFLKHYPFYEERISDGEGHCSPTRMLLTLMLNQSGLVKTSDILFNPKYVPVSIPLSDLLLEAQTIYAFQDLMESMISIFRLHERNWVNLVTLRNIAVDSDRPKHVGSIYHEHGRFTNATININASGFVYLRNVAPHFEFYSNLVGNDRPLFCLPCDGTSTTTETIDAFIRKVRAKVKVNMISMNKFFQNIISTKLKVNPEQYKQSPYVFKHTGETPEHSGLFHATRIVTSHVDYLDHFRQYLIDRAQTHETAIRINMFMVKHIELYVDMLDECPAESEKKTYQEGFRKSLTMIKKSGYSDLKTNISRLD